MAATPAPWGMQFQNLAKKFPPAGVLLGHHVSQNCVSKVSDPGPPSSLSRSSFIIKLGGDWGRAQNVGFRGGLNFMGDWKNSGEGKKILCPKPLNNEYQYQLYYS